MDHPVLVGSQTVHEVEATTPLKGVAHIFLHHITVFQQAALFCNRGLIQRLRVKGKNGEVNISLLSYMPCIIHAC